MCGHNKPTNPNLEEDNKSHTEKLKARVEFILYRPPLPKFANGYWDDMCDHCI